MEPLPPTGISKILALCERLAERQQDLYRLPETMHTPFGELLLIVKGAEMLGLVETVGNEVALTAIGRRVLDAGEQKALLKAQLLKLKVFQHIAKMLQNADENEVPAGVLLEQLAVLLPQEPPRQLFTTLLNWGRFGEVFGYSRETDLFYLQK